MPTTMRDFVCFEAHVEGMVLNEAPDATVPDDWYEAADLLLHLDHRDLRARGRDPDARRAATLLDLELEIGVIIGKEGRDIPVERAAEHIAGFTIYNDFSARDLGAREKRMGLGWAKAKDFANALGPWIVTADEWERYRRGDRYDMELQASRNGEPLGRTRWPASAGRSPRWSPTRRAAPGCAPATCSARGTCGFGCLGELWGRNGRLEPRPLAPGDEVTLTVEGIGTLTNRIVAGVDPLPVPRARPRQEAGV